MPSKHVYSTVTHLSEKDLVETLSDSALLPRILGAVAFLNQETEPLTMNYSITFLLPCLLSRIRFSVVRGLHLRT